MNDRMKRKQARRGTLPEWMVKVAAVTLSICFSVEAESGTITGTVRAEGPKIDEADGGRGAYQSRRYRFAERVDYSELRDFVVYIDQPAPPAPAGEEGDRVERVIQRDAMFQPAVLPVLVGTAVEWPNKDDIYHNVFSLSDAKEFDLGFYKDGDGSEPKRVVFDKPGRVDVFCAIHTQMHCVILVLENPFFTVTDRRGRYTLANVPPGTYQVRAWHPRLPSRVQEVTVPEDGEARVDFTLGFGDSPVY